MLFLQLSLQVGFVGGENSARVLLRHSHWACPVVTLNVTLVISMEWAHGPILVSHLLGTLLLIICMWPVARVRRLSLSPVTYPRCSLITLLLVDREHYPGRTILESQGIEILLGFKPYCKCSLWFWGRRRGKKGIHPPHILLSWNKTEHAQ